jgi:hypothetical protein
MPNVPARPDDQRASDADREAVAEDLRDAFGEGRLDVDEYQRRLDAVWASRTYGELDRLTSDLPSRARRQERAPAEEKRRSDARAWLEMWRTWLGGAVVMIGIWGITSLSSGELQNFWPAIPLGIWAVAVIASALWKDDKP